MFETTHDDASASVVVERQGNNSVTGNLSFCDLLLLSEVFQIRGDSSKEDRITRERKSGHSGACNI